MSCAFSSGPSFQRSQLVCSKRSLALLAADCLALFGTMFLIGVIRVLLGGEISLSQHVPLALFLLVVPAVNAFEGLYSGVPPALPEEMRLLGISTSIAYFSIAIFLFLGRGDLPSRTVYVWSWFLSLGTVPLVRCALRSRFSREAWWRVPTVVFGAGELVPRVTEYLNKHTEAGLLLKAHFVSQKCTEAERNRRIRLRIPIAGLNRCIAAQTWILLSAFTRERALSSSWKKMLRLHVGKN